MQRSLTEVYLHVVWATYRRLPLVRDDLESVIHSHIVGEARRQRCDVLAIGGMPDHVHLALRLPATVSLSNLIQRLKGASSTRIRQQVLSGEMFGWQDNYAAFSVSRSHLGRVTRYIEYQRAHHASGRLWSILEPAGAAGAMRSLEAVIY